MTVEFVGGPKDGETVPDETVREYGHYYYIPPAETLPSMKTESLPPPHSPEIEARRYVLRWHRGEQVYLWEGQ